MTFTSGVFATIAGLIMGLFAYIWKLKGNLEKAKDEKADLQVQAELKDKKEELAKASQGMTASLEKYKNAKEKYNSIKSNSNK